MMERPSPLMAVVVLVATAAFVASPFLVDGFNGYRADQFPVPQEDPLIQPPGWAFAIWGVIYLWLAVSAVYGLFARGREPDWAAMRPSLAVSLALGATWLPVAQVAPVLATILILAMLVAAIVALHDAPMLEFWMARAPVGLYAGWLTAASFVSLGLVLAGYGLASEKAAAIIALVLALAVAGFVVWTVRGTAGYAAGVAWALAAIAIGAISQDLVVFLISVLGALGMAAHAARSGAKV